MPEIKYAIKKNGLQKDWICVQLGISLAYMSYIAGLVGKSPSYVSKLISGDIINYDEMERLKKIIRKYEDELDKNGLLIK